MLTECGVTEDVGMLTLWSRRRDDETGETSSYQLVGSEESDIKSGRLSISAPLARASWSRLSP